MPFCPVRHPLVHVPDHVEDAPRGLAGRARPRVGGGAGVPDVAIGGGCCAAELAACSQEPLAVTARPFRVWRRGDGRTRPVPRSAVTGSPSGAIARPRTAVWRRATR